MARTRELWLILRARNEATSAIRQFARDVRALGTPDMAAQNRISSLQRSIARDRARLLSIEGSEGARNLAIQGRQLAVENAIVATKARSIGIEGQRINIQIGVNKLLDQERSMRASLLRNETAVINTETRELRILQQMARTRAAITSLQPGLMGVGRGEAELREFRAKTGIMRAELAHEAQVATLAAMQEIEGIDEAAIRTQQKRVTIAERDLKAAETAYAIAGTKVKLLDVQIKDLEATLKIQESELAANNARVAELAAEEERLTEALRMQVLQWDKLSIAQRQTEEAELAQGRALAELDLKLRKVRSDYMALGLEAETIQERIAHNQGLLTQAQAAAGRADADRIARMSQGLRNFSRTLTITGVVGVAVFGMLAKSAADFATNATRAATQVNEVTARGTRGVTQVAQYSSRIQQTVIQQMQRFPASAEDMTNTLYDIYSSMKISFGQGTKLLEVFNKAWVAGGMVGNLEDVSHALITLGNNWGLNANNMTTWSRVASGVLATVRYGRINLEQYTQTMNQLSPAFRGAHQSILQMNAALAFLTRFLPSQRVTAAGLARLMEMLQRSATPLMEKFGVSITDASGNLLPFTKVIDILVKAFPKLRTSGTFLQNFFKMITGTQGTVQARRALQAVVLHLNELHESVRNVRGDASELQRSYDAMSKTPTAELMTFHNQLRAIGFMIGLDVIPVFHQLGRVLMVVTKAWLSLSPHTRRIIAEFTAFASIGLIVVGLLGGMGAMILGGIAMWGNLAEAFGGITLAIKGTEAATVALGTELGIAAPEVIVITAVGIAAAAAYFKFHKEINKTAIEATNLGPALKGSIPVQMIQNTKDFASAMYNLYVSYKNFRDAVRGSGKTMDQANGQFAGVAKAAHYAGRAVHGFLTIWHYAGTLNPLNFVINFTIGKVPGGKTGKGWFDQLRGILGDPAGAGAALVIRGANWLKGYFDDQTKKLKEESSKYGHVVRDEFEQNRQRLRAAAAAARGDPKIYQGPFSTAEYLKQIRQAARLNLAIEKAPNLSARYAAQLRYDRFLAEMAKRETAIQKKYQQDLITAATQMLQNTATIADSKAMQIGLRLRQLQAQFKIEPTMGLAKAIQKLQDQFDKLTPAQQAYVNAIIEQMGPLKTVSDTTIADTTRRLHQLEAVMKVHPSMALANEIQKLQKIMEQATPAQQAYAQALEQTLGDVKIISDRQALALARRANQLRQAYEKSPSPAGWARWYDVEHRFTTLATSEQQQMANDMVEFNKQATDKMKENFDSVLNFVRQKYAEILQSNQQAFGTLGSGPMVTKLNAQVKQIEDAGKARADALRAQAQRLQDAVKDANDNIDPRVGNLIDWGLLPKPSDMKNQVDAQVKALNDQADQIEKAAQRRANALQKRLEEHRLTPREIIADLRGQVRDFRRWNHELDQIAKRGAPRALVDQLRQLGPEFEPMLRGILEMTPKQFREYTRIFNRGQEAIHKQTMKQLREQLKVYRRFGAQIAEAISQGIEDESPTLRNAFIKLMKQAFPGIDIPAATPVPRGARGARHPAAHTRHPAGARQPRTAPVTTPTRTQQYVSHTTVNYNYYADDRHSMSPQAYFNKMHFRQRNRTRC